MSRPSQEPSYARLALLPGLLGAIILFAALALIGGDWYIWVQFAVAILALIMCVFAVQGKSYWWLIGLVPLAVVFNPVWPLPIDDFWLRILHVAGAMVFVAAGISIKVPVEDKTAGPAGRYDGQRASSSKASNSKTSKQNARGGSAPSGSSRRGK